MDGDRSSKVRKYLLIIRLEFGNNVMTTKILNTSSDFILLYIMLSHTYILTLNSKNSNVNIHTYILLLFDKDQYKQ